MKRETNVNLIQFILDPSVVSEVINGVQKNHSSLHEVFLYSINIGVSTLQIFAPRGILKSSGKLVIYVLRNHMLFFMDSVML